MPASSRVASARLRRSQLRDHRRLISAAIEELERCQVAMFGAAGAIAAGISAGMLDSDGAYELLQSICSRHVKALDPLLKAYLPRQEAR